jgi:hypothetical protein
MTTAAEYTRTDLEHLIHPLYHPSAHQSPKIWVGGQGRCCGTLMATSISMG